MMDQKQCEHLALQVRWQHNGCGKSLCQPYLMEKGAISAPEDQMTSEHVWHQWVNMFKRDRRVVYEELKDTMKVVSKLGHRLQAYFRVRERPTYEEGVTVRTEPPPHPSIVWVLVEGIHKPRTEWTYRPYRLTEDKPDMLCRSYAELCVWLYTYGVTPPPPDYFTPTSEEQTEEAKSIVRGVMRRH